MSNSNDKVKCAHTYNNKSYELESGHVRQSTDAIRLEITILVIKNIWIHYNL